MGPSAVRIISGGHAMIPPMKEPVSGAKSGWPEGQPEIAILGRVLVVDDDPDLVDSILLGLREAAYTVSGVTSAAEALDLMRRERFDVMLTDLNLIPVDGITLLRRALEIDPGLSGIMMTGRGTVDTAVEAMKAGAVDYVLKPFKLDAVLAVLCRALKLRQLSRENAALNQRLTLRTQELEFVNRELEAFSYSVSHDLRAPLRAIEGFTEALIEECIPADNAKAQDYGVRIRRGTQRMQAMIADLLGLATAARRELHQTQVNLGLLGREIMQRLQMDSPERKCEFVMADDLTAFGDLGLLRLAVENLLGNAWKYSSRLALARIEMGAYASPAEKVFFVRDNGVGFDMADAHRLFVPFQRLRSGHDFDGTGVGLATVQRIVKRHGGRIWAESEVGRGATFYFSLPNQRTTSAAG